MVAWRRCELICGYTSLSIFNAFCIPFFVQANISHCPSLLTLPMQL